MANMITQIKEKIRPGSSACLSRQSGEEPKGSEGQYINANNTRAYRHVKKKERIIPTKKHKNDTMAEV
jgi:hypothetical protein